MPIDKPHHGHSRSLRQKLLAVGFLCLIALKWPNPVCALQTPGYKGYVNDYADMISAGVEMKLERALQSFDLTDSTQIAVLTVPSLEGDSLEEFSIRTVDKWGIGQKGKDNGVLLLVAKKERKIRIEVGRGLEGVLTDLMSGRIIDGIITPLFKAGNFDAGFESGLAAIIQATRGEFTADRLPRRQARKEAPPIIAYLFFGILIISFLGNVSRPLGIVAGTLLLPFFAFLGFSSLSLFMLLLLFPVGALGGFIIPLLFASSMRSRGGYHMGGGFGGSGGGGFGGGFGGFGGGGFSGGGASGGW